MAEYEIYFKESVWKDFKSIPKKDLEKILACIDSLKTDPRQSGCMKLSSQEKYRIRFGQFRIIYSIQDKELTIWIVKVGN